MLIIQRDPDKLGFTLAASHDFSRRFTELSESYGLTLEETVIRALVPSICEALRALPRDEEHVESLIETKIKTYQTYP